MNTVNDSEDGDVTAPNQVPDPRPEQGESVVPAGWPAALNSFLERAFLEADRATGC
jgi:hypothetical protein